MFRITSQDLVTAGQQQKKGFHFCAPKIKKDDGKQN
jgi:hypothetical protein